MNVMSRKISCKQALEYISKKEEAKLSGGQRFALWRHLTGCSLCRIFQMQNRIIGKAMTQGFADSLTTEEKEAIVKSVIKSES